MKRLKTFAMYILCIVLFFALSRLMIFIGLNNTYRNIELKTNLPEGISITSAKATSVNGEIKGRIVSKDLNSKYLKFNFYTDTGLLVDSYYLTLSELKNDNFEFYFKLNYIKSYSVETTDEDLEEKHLENFSEEKFKNYIILSAFIGLLFI